MGVQTMPQRKEELAIDYLNRVIDTLQHENLFVLDVLPSPGAIFDYVDLLDTYDATCLTDIGAAIELGSHQAGAYNEFLAKYDLRWRRHYRVLPDDDADGDDDMDNDADESANTHTLAMA